MLTKKNIVAKLFQRMKSIDYSLNIKYKRHSGPSADKSI